VRGDFYLHQFTQTDAVTCRGNAPNTGQYHGLRAEMVCQVTRIKHSGFVCA
jgi:hypothetical protein